MTSTGGEAVIEGSLSTEGEKKKKTKKKIQIPKAIEEMLNVKTSSEPLRGKYFMTEDEKEYIAPLIAKHKVPTG